MSFSLFKSKDLLVLQLFCAAVFLVLMFTFNGTGDEGDSVSHFLYAKWAFQHPDNFFNHWAKPLFVLLASPFAQFGFTGIKLFNVLNFLLAQYCIYKIAEHLKFPYPILPAALYMIAPMNVYLTLSGLTEPLFASILALSILLTIQNRNFTAALIMSFLPFIRTEGLLFCGLLGGYFLLSGRYKYIPVLLTGHIAYSIVGMFAGKNILWVFNENPYAFFSSNYGKGNWDHFIIKMPEITGWGIYIGLILGLIYGFIKLVSFFKERQNNNYLAEMILVFGGIWAFFFFHTFAWAKGVFNSFGLLRVFTGIMPLIVLTAASGFLALGQAIIREEKFKLFLAGIIVLLILNDFIPKSSYSFNQQTHFSLRADQELHLQVAGYLKKNYPEYKKAVFYFQAPYLSETLSINIFDSIVYRSMHDYRENKPRPANYFIVWDDWYAPVDAHVELDRISADTSIVLLKTFENKDPWNNTRKTILYKNK
jgi:hypothetical protein